MATVDVVVPCYNYGHYLEACVGSVLEQPGVDVRVLIIDDHSADHTPEIGAGLARSDARVTFRRHEQNKGHIATYNEGLAEARGDYVVLLSADDLLTPGSLQRATSLMDAKPSVGLVYGYALPLLQDELPPAKTRARSVTVWRGHDWIRLMCGAGRNFITCPEVVMRTSIQHAIGGYSPQLPHTGDMEIWLRAAAITDIARINGADQAYYRIHPKSMQRTVTAGKLLDLRARLSAFEAVLEKPTAELMPLAGELLSLARSQIASESLDQACRAFDRGLISKEPVDDYVSFALSAYAGAKDLPEWRALQRRIRFGAAWAPFYPPFFFNALLRRVKAEISAAHWRRYGT